MSTDTNSDTNADTDRHFMRRAIEAAARARLVTSPRPWVGAVVDPAGIPGAAEPGTGFDGATDGTDGPHAEVVALSAAGTAAQGATLYVTLEPCSHHGRTPPCADAVIDAGIARVVIGVEDPDRQVSGEGIARLREAGVDVVVGVCNDEIRAQLAPYLTHRATGRPYVVLKLAATLDGGTAAPDGTSQWITGEAARADAHLLRAESDAVLVGAGTVRTDDPRLTARHPDHTDVRQPLRVVLGEIPDDAKILPAESVGGDIADVLDELGDRGVLQVLVEGGATVAAEFHGRGLVDRYVLYLAPALFGGDDARGLFTGPGVATISDLWRGSITDVRRLGDDVRVDLIPTGRDS